MEPDLPIPWLIVLAAVGIAIVVLLAWGGAHLIGRLRASRLGLARTLGLLLVLLFLLDPVYRRTEPDPSAYQVAVLLDQSASMLTPDYPGQTSRLDRLRQDLTAAESGLLRKLAGEHRLGVYSFAEAVRPFQAGLTGVMEGGTALGEALGQTSERFPPGGLGAILLLSDGGSNRGLDPVEAARTLRDSGIPVNVIAYGQPSSAAPPALAFAGLPEEVPSGEVAQIRIRADSSANEPIPGRMLLYSGDEAIASQPLTLPPNGSVEAAFDWSPRDQGRYQLRARFQPDPDSPLADFTPTVHRGITVAPPERLRILYVSDELGWEFPFLRNALAGDERIELDSILRLAPERFLYRTAGTGNKAAERTSYPTEDTWLEDYDALLIQTDSAAALEDAARDALITFVSRRGSGVLFFGSPAVLDEALLELLPVREATFEQPAKALAAEVFRDPLFTGSEASLPTGEPELFLPERQILLAPQRLSRGAQTAATTEDGELPWLTYHAYGAGRSAFLATTASWRWPLSSDVAQASHERFWRALVLWLTSANKPRLRADEPEQGWRVASPNPLVLRVLGSDYRPSPEAQVTAVVEAPSGMRQEVRLNPSLAEPGRFETSWTPPGPGEYRVTYRAQFPGGARLEETRHALAQPDPLERADPRVNERLLRDIARLTGGRFAFADERAAVIDELALANGLPETERRYHWTRSPFLLLLIGLLVGGEILARRHLGLR